MDKIKGFKGFNKDLKCRNFQYEIGKEYTQEGTIECCDNGFHFCENPLHIFNYYKPSDSRYCEVEGSGEIDRGLEKVAVSNIKIKRELDLDKFINVAVSIVCDKAKQNEAITRNICDGFVATRVDDDSAVTSTGFNSAAVNIGSYSVAMSTGDYSSVMNTGDYSVATNSGYCSAAINTGDCSASKVSGEDSVAIAIGGKSKAAGEMGCWIVLVEKDDNLHILDIKSVKVDGRIIKPNIYYELINGKIVEAEE